MWLISPLPSQGSPLIQTNTALQLPSIIAFATTPLNPYLLCHLMHLGAHGQCGLKHLGLYPQSSRRVQHVLGNLEQQSCGVRKNSALKQILHSLAVHSQWDSYTVPLLPPASPQTCTGSSQGHQVFTQSTPWSQN